MSFLWGLDLGGTKIEGVIIDSSAGYRQIVRLRLDTQAQRGYEHIVARIGELLAALVTKSGLPAPASVGIGTPGAVDPRRGTLKNSNTVCLNGRPLRQDLEQALGLRVSMANDANCFALAESTLGAAKGFPTVFGVILGTGVGGGIVVNGRTLLGLHGIAGEWGHNLLEEEGHPCYCGRRGCVETVLAGPALERHYAGLAGVSLRLPDIVRLSAARSDPHASATLRRLSESFGRAIACVINIFDPDAIVIGGGVGNIDLLYGDETRSEVKKYLFNDTFETPILKPALGDSAGVLGAAMLVA